MKTKLLAMGNILMKDDGIAIYLADYMQKELSELGIQVIYGETDIGYCITQIRDGDFVILLDAADLGKNSGDISVLSFHEITEDRRDYTQHCISFLDLLKLYYPEIDGIAVTIKYAEVCFYYGLSPQLQDNISVISQEILEQIEKVLYTKRKSLGEAGVCSG